MSMSIELPEEIIKRLDVLAADTGLSRSSHIKKAIEIYLEDIEDVFLAEEALEEFEKSGREVVSLEEIKKRLGMI